MSQEHFQIFKKPNDHRNRRKQIEYADPDLTESQRINRIQGLQFLQQEVGGLFINTINAI